MKRLFLTLLSAVLILLAIVLGRTLLQPAAQFNPDPVARPAGLDPQRAAESLSAAIRLPTISHQIGAPAAQQAASNAAFAALERWLQERYPHLVATALREEIKGPSILLRWPGKDRQLPPALLMAHSDVVPVTPGTEKDWNHPPFSGAIAEGFVWGRGAIDSKGSMVAMLEAVETLISQGFQPQRDVFLAFGHDEEIGGLQGNKRIAHYLQEKGTRLAWVSDEGGFVVRGQIPGVKQDVAVVGIAEKGYLSLILQTTAAGGHSSQPPAFNETAVGRLSRALQRMADTPFKRDFDGPTAALLESFTPAQSFGYRVIFANLWLFGPLVADQLAATPAGAAQMQTSIAPTMLRAGVKDNVLAPVARATVNIRIHPRDTIDEVLAHVRHSIDDDQVQVKVMPAARNPSAVSDINGETYRRFADVIRQSFSQTLVSPNLTVGATDARYYEALTENVFRFSPLLMEKEDLGRMHATNERVAIEHLGNASGFYYRLLQTLTD
ncbi:M20 family peptidase [Ectopseudomonas mendocina]|uniref:M20 family peptidase n=1 Tax=Ectopseudomonas mendocina TaxID=300 RepID=A0ABZ2RLI1_ECTME